MRVLVTSILLVGCLRPNENYVPEDLRISGPDLAETVICKEHRQKMISAPRAYFKMGSNVEMTEQPIHDQRVLDMLIDPMEVTVSQYRACVEAGTCSPPAVSAGCNWGINGRDNYPVNCVTYEQATQYCASVCARLPTEIEWEYAARGSMNSVYPWGNEAPGTAGKDYTRACLSDQTCPVGQFASTALGAPATPGLFDMAGNVWEWTSSPWPCKYPLDHNDPTCGGLPSDSQRVVRGGYVYNLPASSLRSAYRLPRDQASQASYVGIRCAATPPMAPTS